MRRKGLTVCATALAASSALALESLSSGRAAIRLTASEGSAAYTSDGDATLESAHAQVEDLGDGCRILTVCLSTQKDVDCEKARSISLEGAAVVLILGARLPADADVQPGTLNDVGAVLRAKGSQFGKGGLRGSIQLEEVTPRVKGTFSISDDILEASGSFSAERRSDGGSCK